MIYAIKADNEILYVEKLNEEETPFEVEHWYHSDMLDEESNGHHISELYAIMLCAKDEEKFVSMQKLDIGDVDEDTVYQLLISTLHPIGNMREWGTKEQIEEWENKWFWIATGEEKLLENG